MLVLEFMAGGTLHNMLAQRRLSVGIDFAVLAKMATGRASAAAARHRHRRALAVHSFSWGLGFRV